MHQEERNANAAKGNEGIPGRAALGQSAEISPLLAAASERVQEILETTNEAAERIREDAKAEARQFIQQTRERTERLAGERMDRISKMTAELLDEAGTVQSQVQELRIALEKATVALSEDLGIEESEASAETGEAGTGKPEAKGPGQNSDQNVSLLGRLGRRRRKFVAPEHTEGVSEGARVLALQQLNAGADRETVEARLKEDFDIEDPSAILDSIEAQTPSG